MPTLRPPRPRGTPIEPEKIEDTQPPTESVTIELAGDEPGEVEVEIAPKPEPTEPEKPVTPAPATPPQIEEQNSIAKQLEATKHAERLQAELQRERQRREQLEHEVVRVNAGAEQAQFDAVVNAIGAQQERLLAARQALRDARASNDLEREAEAIEQMTDAKSVLNQLEAGKQAFEARREEVKNAPPPRREVPTDFESRLASIQVPESAKTWLRNNPEYLNDSAKNEELGAIHQWIVAKERKVAFSQEYFDSLDTHTGKRKAADPEPEPAPRAAAPQQRSVPMSAPVSRETPSASGVRTKPGTITLTAEERHIAHKSFTDENLTNAEKERLYAIGKSKYQNRMNGGYRDERHEQERQR